MYIILKIYIYKTVFVTVLFKTQQFITKYTELNRKTNNKNKIVNYLQSYLQDI